MADSPAPIAATPEGRSSAVAVLVGPGSDDGVGVPDGDVPGTALVGAGVAGGAEVAGAKVAEGLGETVGSAPGDGCRLAAMVGLIAGKSSA
ncbi:hypothetical protein [Arthrobacter sp. SO3]|uniref:hypothetical protein n=1 Tax=Arthrobacter sp. SO3 TaxID=1897057 RepID=UPI001D000FD1|nr:hypothetical protein [Arthrobacter sp. SO3]